MLHESILKQYIILKRKMYVQSIIRDWDCPSSKGRVQQSAIDVVGSRKQKRFALLLVFLFVTSLVGLTAKLLTTRLVPLLSDSTHNFLEINMI